MKLSHKSSISLNAKTKVTVNIRDLSHDTNLVIVTFHYLLFVKKKAKNLLFWTELTFVRRGNAYFVTTFSDFKKIVMEYFNALLFRRKTGKRHQAEK